MIQRHVLQAMAEQAALTMGCTLYEAIEFGLWYVKTYREGNKEFAEAIGEWPNEVGLTVGLEVGQPI